MRDDTRRILAQHRGQSDASSNRRAWVDQVRERGYDVFPALERFVADFGELGVIRGRHLDVEFFPELTLGLLTRGEIAMVRDIVGEDFAPVAYISLRFVLLGRSGAVYVLDEVGVECLRIASIDDFVDHYISGFSCDMVEVPISPTSPYILRDE